MWRFAVFAALALAGGCRDKDSDVAAPQGPQWYTSKLIRYEGTLENTGYSIELPPNTVGAGADSVEVRFNLNGLALSIILDPETFDVETQMIQFVGWGFRKEMNRHEKQPHGWLAVFDNQRQVARYVRLDDGGLVCKAKIVDAVTAAKVKAMTAICNSLTATTKRWKPAPPPPPRPPWYAPQECRLALAHMRELEKPTSEARERAYESLHERCLNWSRAATDCMVAAKTLDEVRPCIPSD